MTDSTDARRGKVPLREFLGDFRSVMSDQDLKAKYQLSAQAFLSLIKALLSKKVITPNDLAMRKEMAVQRDLARESQFLAGLYICPNCSHPHPTPFKQCPACGVNPEECFSEQDVLSTVTTTSGHIYVGNSDTGSPAEVAVEEEPEIVEAFEVISEDTLTSTAQETGLADETEADTAEKHSRLKSVRSFLSKKFKKP